MKACMLAATVTALTVSAFVPAAAAAKFSHSPQQQRHHQQQHHHQQQPCSLLCCSRRQLIEQEQPWNGLRNTYHDWNRTDARRPTQGSAYANSQGPDEGDEPGDPFTAYSTEPTSVTVPAGVYFHEDGDQALALDPQLGVWGGAWSGHKLNPRNRFKYRPKFKRQNPQRLGNDEDGDADNTTTISHYTLEAGDQRGMQALSGTYEGARAAAGSNTAFNLATKDSIGGSTYTNDNDAFGPTPGRPTVFKDGERRSVAFTDIPPNSAAHAGTGYGVVAAAAGWEVAATARSGRTPGWEDTLGSREPGKNRLLDDSGKHRHRLHRKLLHTALPAAESPCVWLGQFVRRVLTKVQQVVLQLQWPAQRCSACSDLHQLCCCTVPSCAPAGGATVRRSCCWSRTDLGWGSLKRRLQHAPATHLALF